jgi:CheY-like chemotaxis protein
MPRLLLVDDNPSIHRIAESLLAPTAIELVCVDSAAEALERFQNGERFDVAMIDTAMPGMDGWTLLERLRALEATARMPIAMMAGVLDPVDPVKIQNAPIQGFLKKPIELRELGDRVNTLLATPVAAAGPVSPVELAPTATRPMSPADLAQVVEEFPEFRPTIQLPEEDLLVLGPEDLWMDPEAPVVEAPMAPAPEAPAPALPDLELEELDLEAFQDLAVAPPSPGMAAEAPVEELVELEPAAVPENTPTLDSPSLPELETLGAEELSGLLGEDLPELPTPQPDPFHSMAPEAEPIRLGADPEPEPEPAWGFPEAVAPLTPSWEAPAAVAVAPTPAPEPEPEPEPVAAPSAMPSAAPAPSDATALVQAILANSEALEALAQALAGRLSEKALREVAWEVIPDLAKKLHS